MDLPLLEHSWAAGRGRAGAGQGKTVDLVEKGDGERGGIAAHVQ